MKELLVFGLFAILLQACPCSVPGGESGHITGVTDNSGHVTQDGGTTTERVQTVTGTVNDPNPSTSDVFEGRVVLERNGEKQYVTPVRSEEGTWTFTGTTVLTHGTNTIDVYVEDENGNKVGGSNAYTLNANIPVRDLTVTLTWDTDGTDMDMHVYSPDEQHAWYNNKLGITGAFIDVDDTDGFGPETFTMENATAGQWVVKVRYFDNHEVQTPTNVTVKVTRHEQNTQTYTHTFTANQANQDDASNDWEATSFSMP